MQLPKYITHSALFIVGATLTLYLLWLKTPSPAELHAQSLTDDLAKINKKALLEQNDLYQITDFTKDGFFIFDSLAAKARFSDPRFQNLTQVQYKNLKEFFVGKFLVYKNPKEPIIPLPARLFEPACFAMNAKERESSKQCPLVIEP